ncbi:MAG: guanylate kinase [Clostridia bacterium]|nr:guanylate kinase [Clostridia bacterium]
MIENKRGLLLVISGPSGVGKGTICKELLNDSTILSVSATTRNPRDGEENGVSYFFYDKEKFKTMIENDELMEWAEYCGNFYGTPKAFVESKLDEGKNVILEIEVQGAMKVKEKYPEGVYIFILPPSLEELKNRIIGRGTEDESVIETRMNQVTRELSFASEYNYFVENDKIENAVKKINAIIEAEKAKSDRCSAQLI